MRVPRIKVICNTELLIHFQWGLEDIVVPNLDNIREIKKEI